MKTVPRWLSPSSVSRVVRADRCTTNQHGIMTPDHLDVQWPLPVMFGQENYSFSLIDIPDDRYAEEAGVMSQKLIRLFYDLQIVEYEWRKTYKRFLQAEDRVNHLTPGVLQKSRDKAEKDLSDVREQLLRLQDQRDLFDSTIQKIFERCREIKASILKEHDLEKLREKLNDRVRSLFTDDDIFWKTKFKVHTSHHRQHSHRHHRSNHDMHHAVPS
jgi:chromosome segregation ATPase